MLDRGGGFEAEAVDLADQVLELRRRARFDVAPALSLIGQARLANVRLIHAGGWMSCLAAWPAARRLGVPLVNACFRKNPAKSDARDRLARWCARHSDAVVANGPHLEAIGLDGHRCARVIANGIDLERFADVVPDDGPNADICMVANFSTFKDHASLIRALPRIRAAVPNAGLTLVGSDAGTLGEARRVVEELGLGASVRFVTDCTRPERFLAASTVSVLSTHGEGLSNAILESMALARPVVATDCPGNAALIRNDENGFLVSGSSPESLATRIVELLGDAELAREMGARGRRIVEQRYTLGRMVADYEALYDELGAAR